MEVFFEVLTDVNYNKAVQGKHYNFLFPIPMEGHCYVPGISKCFFEHTILCALEIYKNRELLKLYTDETLTNDEKCQKRPLLQFDDWDKDHKHGSVLKKPETDTESGQIK